MNSETLASFFLYALPFVPAMATILICLLSHRVELGIFSGIIFGGLALEFKTHFISQSLLNSSSLFTDSAEKGLWTFFELFPQGLKQGFHFVFQSFQDSERLSIALFVIFVGIMVEIIGESGAAEAFAHLISRWVNSPKKVRLGAWFMSLCLFFDDYANVLITGLSFKKLGEKHKVSSAQLAYIIDSVAAFVSMILISTWSAYEGALMLDASQKVAFKGSETSLFLQSLPYHFFTLTGVYMAFLCALTGEWFSHPFVNNKKQSKKNKATSENGSSFPPSSMEDSYQESYKESYEEFFHPLLKNPKRIHPHQAFIPILILILFTLMGLFFTGLWKINNGKNIFQNTSLISIEGISQILGAAPTIFVLTCASLCSLLYLIISLKWESKISFSWIRKASLKGFYHVLPACLVIILSKGLSNVSDSLKTAELIIQLIDGFLSPTLAPTLFFGTCVLLSVVTGFSWSSMALIMPIAYQYAAKIQNSSMAALPLSDLSYSNMIYLLSGAVVSGSIAGAQLVPYSDTSLMTATGCGISPLYHVKTQFYSILISILIAMFSYLLYSYTGNLIPTYMFILNIPLFLFLCLSIFRKKNFFSI